MSGSGSLDVRFRHLAVGAGRNDIVE